MPPLHLLIKPASGCCNMACTYCFYRDEVENRVDGLYGMMSEAALEQVIRRAFEFASGECTFAFQGGEPTLAGLPFFRRLVTLVEKWNVAKVRVNYAIQTNGLLVDREWAEFFHENHFLVGLSMDGNKAVHDTLRLDRDGKGTFSKVLHAAQLFNAKGVEFNILTVVTAQLAKNIRQVYPFFLKSGFVYQQYIPCLDAIGETRGSRDYSLTPELYGQFLCDLFDLWYLDIKKGKRVSVRYFDNLLRMLCDTPPESCGMLGTCSIQNVVEADGSVYPCDFYVLDAYKLGNVFDMGFGELHQKRLERGFLQSSMARHADCEPCPWRNICRGGCRRDRDQFDGGEPAKNYFCEAYKMFFAHSITRLQELAYRGY